MPLRLESQFTNLHMLCRTSQGHNNNFPALSFATPFLYIPFSYTFLPPLPHIPHPYILHPHILHFHIPHPHIPFSYILLSHIPLSHTPHTPLPHIPLLYTPLLPRALNDAYNFSTITLSLFSLIFP